MISRERVERAARIYRTTGEAARAMGITPQSLARLCRRYGITTPTMQHHTGGTNGNR